jgi:hypothetical protein
VRGCAAHSYMFLCSLANALACPRRPVRVRILAAFLFSSAGLGCGGDRSITRGADGSAEWARRLESAVTIGIARDSARAILERSGFRCQTQSSGAASLWCDKESGGRFAIVRRRWQALLAIEDGHVTAVHATTGLIGP